MREVLTRVQRAVATRSSAVPLEEHQELIDGPASLPEDRTKGAAGDLLTVGRNGGRTAPTLRPALVDPVGPATAAQPKSLALQNLYNLAGPQQRQFGHAGLRGADWHAFDGGEDAGSDVYATVGFEALCDVDASFAEDPLEFAVFRENVQVEPDGIVETPRRILNRVAVAGNVQFTTRRDVLIPFALHLESERDHLLHGAVSALSLARS